MSKALPFELLVCVQNLDFWATTELVPGCDRLQVLAVFEELAGRARALSAPEHDAWLEERLLATRRRIDRRIQPRPLDGGTVSASAKAHAVERRRSNAPGGGLHP
ncbi:hypothetical protein [Cognatilysobacter bugurensis]|uniref:Uncharacterized protein n=1 Tax=Cognatilysobacter bugurensis TaxID=543356 RepID=A0A918T127_9GAMM|nr:hypothetical protein [Lysobacter bugurensis]GHA84077.1 hypothetical protein GCM10007067_22840 [Lysobacter bugurensis]